MKKIFLLLFISFNGLFAQNKELDSLNLLVKNAGTDLQKLEVLNKITSFYSLQDLEKAIVYAKKGVALADKTNDKNWQPKFYEMKGRIHANMLQLDSASLYFSKAEKSYK